VAKWANTGEEGTGSRRRVASCKNAHMDFAITDEQRMLRDSVRSFLEARVPLPRVRELMETEDGFDREVWAEMAAMGWQAMAIPEEYGGAGFTFRELGILMEEMGRALTPGPFLSSVVLGAGALLIAGTPEQKATYLPGIASGERIAALAAVEPSGDWDPDAIAAAAIPGDAGFTISGEKSFVVDGHVADTLLVSARDSAGGVGIYVVDAGASGLETSPLETLDMTRKQATVRLDGVVVDTAARLTGDGAATIESVYEMAVVALAYEQVGGAQRCLEMSVDYAKERHQFGRPIGSFQAVKHMCADMLVAVEAAKSVAYYAGWAVTDDPAEAAIAAPLAKSSCSDAYFEIAGDTIQVHGGIGFTWEHDAHLFFKRAKSDELLFGDPTRWRARLADRLDLSPAR